MLAATPLLGTPAGTFGFVAPGCAPGPRTPSWDVPRVGTLCVAPRGWKKQGGVQLCPQRPRQRGLRVLRRGGHPNLGWGAERGAAPSDIAPNRGGRGLGSWGAAGGGLGARGGPGAAPLNAPGPARPVRKRKRRRLRPGRPESGGGSGVPVPGARGWGNGVRGLGCPVQGLGVRGTRVRGLGAHGVRMERKRAQGSGMEGAGFWGAECEGGERRGVWGCWVWG